MSSQRITHFARFRYAYLQLERLLDSGILLRSDVARTLEALPPTLNKTYDAILHEINPLHQNLALAALRWLTFSQQPLLMEELIEACTISLGGGGQLIEEHRLSPKQMLTLLPNLISMESTGIDVSHEHGERDTDATSIVAFAHFSVKEYLLGGMATSLQTRFDLGSNLSHGYLARSCVAYLVNTNTAELRTAYFPLREYAWELWSFHTLYAVGSVENTSSLAESLLETIAMSEAESDHSVGNNFAQRAGLIHNQNSHSRELQPALDWLQDECNIAGVVESLRNPFFFNDGDDVVNAELKPLEPDHFRIVRVYPSRHTFAPLRCRTVAVPLDSRPRYEAVSYTWGNFEHKGYLWLNGIRQVVTKNASRILRNLRNGQGSARTLWVDSLCINQRDMEERSAQVAMMGLIYSNADQVAICLDSGGANDTWALRIVTSVARIAHTYSRDAFEELKTIIAESQGRNPFVCVRNLFEHDWFRRSWTIQEAVLGQKGVILYGTDPLPLDALALLANAEDKMSRWIQFALPSRPLDESVLLESPEWKIIKSLFLVRQRHHADGANSASSLLFASRFHRSRVPVDRLYSLLAMFPKDVVQQITVDYSEYPIKIAMNVLRAIITAEGNLDVLSILSAQMNEDPSAEDYPSWAAPFLRPAKWPHPSPLLFPELNSGEDSGFRAGGTSFDHPPVFEGDLLGLEGLIFDVIERVENNSEEIFLNDIRYNVGQSVSFHRRYCHTRSGFECWDLGSLKLETPSQFFSVARLLSF